MFKSNMALAKISEQSIGLSWGNETLASINSAYSFSKALLDSLYWATCYL